MQRPRHHATQPVAFSEDDLAQIVNGSTRTILVSAQGFAALYADIRSNRILSGVVSGAHTADGPWVELATFSTDGSTVQPVAVGCKRGHLKIELTNSSGSATTNFLIAGALHTAVLS